MPVTTQYTQREEQRAVGMGTLQERAVALISQPPSARTERNIEMVLPWLQKRSELLMELDRGKAVNG